jgi:hypothetical protein
MIMAIYQPQSRRDNAAACPPSSATNRDENGPTPAHYFLRATPLLTRRDVMAAAKALHRTRGAPVMMMPLPSSIVVVCHHDYRFATRTSNPKGRTS